MPSAWGIRAALRNAYHPPASPDHVCHVPVRVRLDYHRDGERVVDAVATGWRGQLVRVYLSEPEVEIWLLATDVRRR